MRKRSRGTSPICTRAATIHARGATSPRPSEPLRRSASATTARSPGSRAAELAEAIDERERIESDRSTRVPTTRTSASHEHGRPGARRARRASSRRRAPRSRRSCSSSGSRGPSSRTTPPRRCSPTPALEHWRHWLAVAAQVPAVPAHRAGGEDRHREVRLRRQRLVAAVLGAPRRDAGRRSTARRSRSKRRCRGSTRPIATRGATRPRR